MAASAAPLGANAGTTPAADKELMPPPAPRQGKVVLEESQYADAIEAIIERDFFPDVAKMQNQLEWMEAIQSGDPAQIKRAQLAIARRRAGLPATPATGTRGGTNLLGTRSILRTPAMTPLGLPVDGTPGGPAPGSCQAQEVLPEVPRAPAMSLDTFLSSHTGEDNASFEALQQAGLARKRAKMSHHLKQQDPTLLLEGPHPTDEYGTSGQQPSTLIGWKHVPKSSLYFDSSQRAVVPYSQQELRSRAQGPPKSIAHNATRLLQPADEAVPPAAAPAGAGAAAMQLGSSSSLGPVGTAAAEAGGGTAAAPGTHGYGYMATPTLAPGVQASPLMTWGVMASTPLRLEGNLGAAEEGLQALDSLGLGLGLGGLMGGEEDATPGPHFRLPEQRNREVAAQAYLARRQARNLDARRRNQTPLLTALRRSTGGGGATGPRHGSTPTPHRPLSAAGLRLAVKLKGGSTSQLRAGYSGATPVLRAGSSSRRSTPAPAGGGGAGSGTGRGLKPGKRRVVQVGSSSGGGRVAAAVREAEAPGVGGGRDGNQACEEEAARGGQEGRGNITDGLLNLG